MINKITTLLIIILVNTNAIAQQAEYILGDQFFNYAIQDKDSKNYLGAINNLKISNDYYAKLGSEKDSLIGFNYYLIGQFKDSLKLDSGFYYFEKSYEKLSKYPNQFLYQINDIELYLSSYYQSIKPDVSAYYYKCCMISSDLIYGIPNYFSLSAAFQLSFYYREPYSLNLDSSLYFTNYILNNDSCYKFSLEFNVFENKIATLLALNKDEEIPSFIIKYQIVIDQYEPNNYLKKLYTYQSLSMVYEGLKDDNNALTAKLEEYKIVEKWFSNNDTLISKCFSGLGAIYCSMGDYTNSRVCLERAKRSFLKLENINSEDYYQYLFNENMYYQSINKIDSAIVFLQLKLELLKKYQNRNINRIFDAAQDIAQLHDQNFEYDKSDIIYSGLYKQYITQKYQPNYIFLKNYLGHLADEGKIEMAKSIFREETKYNFTNVDHWQTMFLIYGNEILAKYYSKKGIIDSTYYFYNEAIKSTQFLKSNYDKSFYEVKCSFDLAMFYYDLEEYEKSIRLLKSIINKHESTIGEKMLVSEYFILAQAYLQNNNVDSALFYIDKPGLINKENYEESVHYYTIKSQIYNLKFHNLKSTLSYLDTANMIIQKSPNDFILHYVNYITSYCYLYLEYNQKDMAIIKLMEGVDYIQKLKGDSSIILTNLFDNSILETTLFVGDKNYKDVIKLKNLKEALLTKYNKKDLKTELQDQLQTMLFLNPSDAIWYAHTIVKKEKLVDLLGYQMGLMSYYQLLSAKHAQLNNMDSALYYANLNLDIVKKGLVNTYNTKYNALLGVLRCYNYKGDYLQYFKMMNLYKEMKLDTLDLEYLNQTRLAYSTINSDSGFYYSDLMMFIKENSLNEKLFFLPYNERSKLLLDYRKDFNNHESILYRLRDELNLTDAYNSIIRSENMLLRTELVSRKNQNKILNNEPLKILFERKAQLQDSINSIMTNTVTIDSKKDDSIIRLKKEQYENQRKIFELLGDTLTSLNNKKNNFQLLKSNITDNEIVIHYRFIPWSQNEGSSLYYAFVYDKYSDKPIINCRFTKDQLNSILNNGTVDEIYSSNELYNLILKPLEGVIKSTHNKLIIIPDEDLFKVSFNAMRMANDSFLIDKKEIAVLSTVNELVGKKDNSGFKFSSSTNVLLYGAINYAEKDTSVISSIKNLEKDSEPYFVLNRNSKFKLNYLPGTLEEISSVSKLLESRNANYQIVKGDDAKEEKFYEYLIGKSPAILHFATHGYFLDDTVKTMDLENININNSLMQNGIFLSNSQKSWDEGIIRYDKSDGIINGLEIASTDLSNTDLVVLSACNSGRGKIISREGVYGLQKGFKLAGAKSILYTLWPIPDKETVLFITKFYQYLIDVKNPNLAYRKTVSELLLLDQYRATPSIWAGFVLVN